MERCDSSGYLWIVVGFGEGIAPRPIDLQVLFHILHRVPDAVAGMIAGALIVDVAKGPLKT